MEQKRTKIGCLVGDGVGENPITLLRDDYPALMSVLGALGEVIQ